MQPALQGQDRTGCWIMLAKEMGFVLGKQFPVIIHDRLFKWAILFSHLYSFNLFLTNQEWLVIYIYGNLLSIKKLIYFKFYLILTNNNSK